MNGQLSTLSPAMANEWSGRLNSNNSSYLTNDQICRPLRSEHGVRFRVWAPRAERVDLVLIQNNQPTNHLMERDLWGYHEVTVPNVKSGDRYAYQLDNGPMRPDPCSLWQPDGVHRPSAVYFPDEFHWTDENWPGIARSELVFYELHVGTFTREGTFDAAIERLSSLKALGVTAIEIMPISQFPGARNWGYDGAHLFAPQNTYGGPEGFQRLIDAAHREGLAVILDLVLNHFGPEGNYIGEFGPYYSVRYTTPWGPAFNFDERDSDPVREFVLDNIWHWIADFHLDGLRLDAVHAMFDISPHHILAEAKTCADQAAAQRGVPCHIVAESLMNDVRMVRSSERGGYGLDAEWNEDFHHSLVAFLTGERSGKYVDFGAAQQLCHVLQNTFHLSGGYSRFRRRRWGAPVGDIPGDRFVIGTQNHDHIGNRACGERLCHLVEPAIQRLSASLMLLAPYLPLIFMGEEYGEPNPFMFFCSFEDKGLIENVRRGRARDYELSGPIPDPQDEATFLKSKLSWNWNGEDFRSGLRQLYQDLLLARREWPALQDFVHRSSQLLPLPTDINEDATHQAGVLQLVRGGIEPEASKTLTCLFNLTNRSVPLPEVALASCHVSLFRSEQLRYGSMAMEQHPAEQLRPHECMVFGPSEWRCFIE